MRMDYWNLREVLSWMAMFFINGERRDLSRFSGSFHIFSLGPFGVGRGRCGCSGWFLRVGWGTRFECNGLNGGQHNLGHWRLGWWVEVPYKNPQREIG